MRRICFETEPQGTICLKIDPMGRRLLRKTVVNTSNGWIRSVQETGLVHCSSNGIHSSLCKR